MNGLFSFTPDGGPLLGESKEAKGFWIAEAVWITHAIGVGKVMAEWLTDGVPSIDLAGADVHRFEPYAKSPAYILARSSQSFREVYDIIHPQQPMEEPRPLRTSPYYSRQKDLGAYFLEASGWERPQWFEANQKLLDGQDDVLGRGEWAGRYWSEIAAAEARATRERVALYDMTSLKRAEVTGPGAMEFLQHLTTGQIDRPPGKVTYTLMLDEAAGVKSDITVARLEGERFQLGLNGPRDIEWMERHLPSDGSVQVRDITPGTCCIGVWGPSARDVVQSLSDEDFSNEAFGFFNARYAYLREVPVTALRLSYVGELGWEIYTTSDMGLRLWDLLWDVGQPYGVVAGGRAAFNSMRIEKGYRAWGTDMTTEHDPYEAGLGFAVKADKGDFIGREALAKRKEAGPRRRLVCTVLDDPNVVVMGYEPVFVDGRAVGYVTSADFGYTLGQSIAYAWVPPEHAEVGSRLEIQYFDERHPATVTEEPLFDPGDEEDEGVGDAKYDVREDQGLSQKRSCPIEDLETSRRGEAFDGRIHQSRSRHPAVHEDLQVPVLLRLAPAWGPEVQRLQPPLPPALLQGPGRGVLAAPRRRYPLGRRGGRAAGRDHGPRRLRVHQHAHPAQPQQVRRGTVQVRLHHQRRGRHHQRPRAAAPRREPLLALPRRQRRVALGAGARLQHGAERGDQGARRRTRYRYRDPGPGR